ncbi:MAG: N4-gp56 family major capsid protein, partial [Brooklawnia sp.]
EAGAGEVVRKQTSTDLPIVKTMDLSRGKGDEVEFQFLQPVGAYPIMGSETAEGKGTGLSYDTARVRVNQARFPVDLGDTMTSIRSAVDFRRLGRPVAQSLMDSYMDQSLLVHMAGARGFHDNIEWRIPVAANPKFAAMAVNPVKAPTKNRHFIADGTNGIIPFALSGADVDIATTDVLSMDVVDAIRTTMESIALPPPAVKIPGDVVAEDSPLRVLLVSPAQYHSFAQDPNFRQFQANALARASKAKQHPLFLGECGLWNGVLIMKMPKPIRFYAGDAISYCTSHTAETEATATVPAGFGTTHAIDRAILLGGQAIAQAFAASGHGGMPFFWKEKEFDHDDKMELLIGAIQGISKVRWLVDQGNGVKHYTDHGIVAIDTAVPIIAARQ